jgi:hypothetical protein
MAVIRLTHPIHGSYIESSEAAAEKAVANGWSRDDAPAEQAQAPRKRRKRAEQVGDDDDRN